MWVKENRMPVTWPRKMIHSIGTRDENRYCKFHEDYGHDTEEYYDLKKEIKKLIDSGALRKFTSHKEDKEQRKEGTDKEEKKEEERGRKKEIAGVINVIIGGKRFKEGRKRLRGEIMQVAEQAGRRAEAAKVITFSAEDGTHAKGSHNDALVVEAIVNNFLVMKLLVDEGSAMNLITWETFKGIGRALGQLKHCPVPIIGLGGTPIQPRGLAEIMVEFGRGGREMKEVKTMFLVVDMSLAYNGIPGRPFLYSSRAITSIRYLIMKIPTTEGVISEKGDQEPPNATLSP
ncbi:uncharacterized protein LOC126656994 [Mercurialis annua]|uniref:uncharacterized protein LOC126656994 n=1 Tax=Mercurialis annua TaxID=3986 RepID=UPI002160BF1D|nr:uncharacterized protein LOC126656994 [Mercurialis annua]